MSLMSHPKVWSTLRVAMRLSGYGEKRRARLPSEIREPQAFRRVAADMLQITPPMPDGAAHIWLPMPLADAERLVRRAAQAGVRLTPPDATSVSDDVAGVRLCLMAPARRSDLVRALRVVSDLRQPGREAIV